MSVVSFVNLLLDTGRARVPAPSNVPPDLGNGVAELDQATRAGLAFEAPAVLGEVAEWGLLLLYCGCQALVYREVDADSVRAALSKPCPAPPSPAACYSADLGLQFLPELI